MRTLLAALAALAACMLPSTSWAWSTGPLSHDPVSGTIYNETEPTLVADGAGGVIAAWDYFAGNHDIRAQRLDAAGKRSWTSSGIVICNATGSQTKPRAVADGSGGAIIVWNDERSGTKAVYAQRVSSSGSMSWTANGVLVSNAPGSLSVSDVASDGSGGVLVALLGTAASVTSALVQRVGASGTLPWGATGKSMGTFVSAPAVTGDGSGGAFVAWGAGAEGVRVNRLDGSGNPSWGAQGSILSTNGTNLSHVALATDGSGGILAVWSHQGGASFLDWALRARRSNGSGTAQGSEVVLGTKTSISNPTPTIVADGSGGVVAAWVRSLNVGQTLEAQRVDSTGQLAWGTTSVTVASGSSLSPALARLSGGNVAIAWTLPWQSSNPGLVAQSFGPTGAVAWTGGVQFYAKSSAAAVAVPFGTGAVIAFHTMPLSGSQQVGAKLLNADGTNGDEPVDAGVDSGSGGADAGLDAGSGGADASADAASGGAAGASGSGGSVDAGGGAGAAGIGASAGAAGAGGRSSGGSGGASSGGTAGADAAVSGGAAGTGGAKAGASGDDGGCGCRVRGAFANELGLALVALVAALFALRRRR